MTGYGHGLYGGGLYGGALAAGARLLPEIPDGLVAVQIAWGADLTDTIGAGWAWTDVTDDVRLADGLSGSAGRNDEASTSQPAKLALTLDNSVGDYSLGGQSANYPNVRRNTPVRVLVDPDDGGGNVLLFQGYAVGFTPSWDVRTGRLPVVQVEAAGSLRRLAQGKDPLRSALYRWHTIAESPLEYWPLEEDKAATAAVNAAGGGTGTFAPTESGGVLYGKVAWGGDTDNPATARAVQVSAGGVLTLPVRAAQVTNYWVATWSMRYTSGSGAFTRFHTSDVVGQLNYYGIWYTDGSVEVYAVTLTGAGLILSWSNGDNYLWDDVWHSWALKVDQTGAAVVTTMYRDGVQVATNSATPGYRHRPTDLTFTGVPNPGGTEDPVTVAHAAVWTSDPGITTDCADAAAAWVGELADARLSRLCSEQGVDLDVTGTTSALMGPQRPLAFLTLLRECESADLGILYDGSGPGLAYLARDQRENATVAVTLDATDLVMPFAPVDDDQRTVNRSTATGRTGAKYTAEDVTGPMGTAQVGIYDSSVEVNLATDGEVPSYADWQVHLGTVEGYRYPSVTVDVKARPTLAPAVLALAPSARLVVENVGSVMAAMPTGDVDLLVEGLAWSMDTVRWKATAKCSPYGPWVVGELASTTGDTDPEVIRLGGDGSTLTADYAAGATSISVATASGPLWTTASDDYPLTLDVGGVPVVASACSGASSPQTFTVTALTDARSSGTTVTVWNPPGLGL